jgi:tetratricopeptide (TPR) repeat protein
VRARGFDVDLPAPAADLPARKGAPDLIDLPIVAADLPVAAIGLPVIAAGLPSPAAALPTPAAALPTPAAALPTPAAALPVPVLPGLPVHAPSLPEPVTRGFGEIELPLGTDALATVVESLAKPTATDRHFPARLEPSPEPLELGGFGEIELPREAPVQLPAPAPSALPAMEAPANPAEFEFEDRPRSRGSTSNAARVDGGRAGGGMTFGEVDFGGAEAGGEPSIGVDVAPSFSSGAGAPAPPAPAPPIAPPVEPPVAPPMATAPVTVSLRPARRGPSAPPPRKRSYRATLLGALAAAVVLAGAALQLTPYGAFGYLYVIDRMHGGDYDRAMSLALLEAERALAADTYDAATTAVDAAARAHDRMPRARALTAYAAWIDFATTVRYGPDTARAARAKQLLAELSAKDAPKYFNVAQAAQLAAEGDLDKARKALDDASKTDTGDPIQNEIALLRGDLELAARDGAAALAAFKRGLQMVNDARAHFGLARAYDLLGDGTSTKKEIEATLAASPQHPGALTLRAHGKSMPVDETQAGRDLAQVLEGPARAKASPSELSNAYSARAWVSLERGAPSEAREAFAQAVKLYPRNVEALTGEGRLLLNEGRYTEALSRLDTALQFDPASPEAIASDAEAKLGLERLADAKQQLVVAKQRFPKNIPILLALGKVEQHLGNNDAAEAVLRAGIALADPGRREAVLPYVALSELLSVRGRVTEAKNLLDDARKKLPPSGLLDRAFGEVAEQQGDYDTAIADYRSAIAKEPRDVATHFRLAVALRRIRKFDEAGAELDRVAAVDRDFPGLALEHGLLFEESGDIQKAIEEFKGALAKAPEDPDLQLRVGSAYVAIGRSDDALPMLRKVIEKRPTSAEAHHYIGRALMLRGRAEQTEALRYLKRAVDLDPNRAEFHVYLAWAANEATPAQLELARDEIDKAMALDKNSAEAYWQRGVLERMQGAVEDAVKDARRALQLRPSRYEAHATLAECFEDKNDYAMAIAEWSRAIAGDGNASNPDGTVPHPFWRYKYGKLLFEHGNVGAALGQLLPAASTAEKADRRPGWLAPLEFLTAESLRRTGKSSDAVEHYRRFLEIAPMTSPDRADAQAALAQLTGNR